MMAIENIITMVLINGLPDEFKYMKDLMFSKDLMGEFPDLKETLLWLNKDWAEEVMYDCS